MSLEMKSCSPCFGAVGGGDEAIGDAGHGGDDGDDGALGGGGFDDGGGAGDAVGVADGGAAEFHDLEGLGIVGNFRMRGDGGEVRIGAE